MLVEALKMKISQFRRQDKQDVRVIVTTMIGEDTRLKDLQEKYLPDIPRESFMMLDKLASELNVKYDENRPQVTIRIYSPASQPKAQILPANSSSTMCKNNK